MIGHLASYIRERFRLRIYGPAIVLHAAAAWWAAGTSLTWTSSVRLAGLATLLLLQDRKSVV